MKSTPIKGLIFFNSFNFKVNQITGICEYGVLNIGYCDIVTLDHSIFWKIFEFET